MTLLVYIAAANQSSIELLKWIGLLIVLVLAGGWGVLHLRKKLFEPDQDQPLGVLEHLRQAVRDGEMTQEEFEQAKKAMAEKLRGEPAVASERRPAPPQSGDKAAQPNAGTDSGPDDSPDGPPPA